MSAFLRQVECPLRSGKRRSLPPSFKARSSCWTGPTWAAAASRRWRPCGGVAWAQLGQDATEQVVDAEAVPGRGRVVWQLGDEAVGVPDADALAVGSAARPCRRPGLARGAGHRSRRRARWCGPWRPCGSRAGRTRRRAGGSRRQWAADVPSQACRRDAGSPAVAMAGVVVGDPGLQGGVERRDARVGPVGEHPLLEEAVQRSSLPWRGRCPGVWVSSTAPSSPSARASWVGASRPAPRDDRRRSGCRRGAWCGRSSRCRCTAPAAARTAHALLQHPQVLPARVGRDRPGRPGSPASSRPAAIT